MVLSDQSFTTRSGRVLVVPGWSGPAPAVMPPWRIPVDDRTFAVDRTLFVKEEHLLDRIGEARYTAVMAARRALLAIT